MKLYLKIGIILLIALIVWLLLQEKDNKISHINTVNLQPSHLDKQVQPKAIKKIKVKQTQTITNSEISEEEKARLAKELKQLSYIQMYDKYVSLYTCIGYIEQVSMKTYELENNISSNKEVDFLQEYKDKIRYNSNNRQHQATDKQIRLYLEHIDNCKQTIAQVESLFEEKVSTRDGVYNRSSKLRELMKKTKPQSDEGKILKATIANVKRLTASLNELEKLKKGKPTVSQEEIWKIESELESLRREVAGRKQVSEEDRDEQNLKIHEEEYKQKKIYLASLYEHDEQAFAYKVAEFHSLIKETEKSLHTKYPRVFYEAFAGVNFSFKDDNKLPDYYARERYKNLGVEFSILSEQIKNQISIKDDAYFNQILQPALDLYLCYLGQDCQLPVNRHLANYCYIPQIAYSNSSTGLYFEACDVDLQEFYLEHYLTENQVEDLSLIFDYLVEIYAK